MAMRFASPALFAARTRSASTSAVGDLLGYSGAGVGAILYGAGVGLPRSTSLLAIVRAAEAAAYGGRRIYCCASEGRFPSERKDPKSLIYPKGFKSNLSEEAIPSGFENSQGVKIVKLEMELTMEKALSAQKNEYNLKMDALKSEYDNAIAKAKSDFEVKLAAAQKEWKDDFDSLKPMVDKISVQFKVAEESYKNAKENFDLRIHSVQFGVVKAIGGLITIVGGSVATYLKLKEELKPYIAKLSSVEGNPLGNLFASKDWFD